MPSFRRALISATLAAIVAGLLLIPGGAPAQSPAKDPQIGQDFRVPYRRTLTNHYLVRVRINGKGPFNFLVDTGAPALFIGTEAAKKAGLPAVDEKSFWTEVETFDIEGGISLKRIKSRVWDAFQLKGMNALGLAGAQIDGILGFTVLARFRMEFDPRSDRMVWTRLDYDPKDPFVPDNPKDREAPADVQAMEMIGPMMQVMSLLIGKQPEDTLKPQGLLGFEVEAREGAVRVARVLAETPAARAGLEPGDLLLKVRDASIQAPSGAHAAIAKIAPGDRVELRIRRGSEEKTLTLTAAEGL